MNDQIYRLTVPTPFPVGDAHLYLLKGDTLTLIDAGVKTQQAWDSFVKQLNNLGYSPVDIEQIILTHHHPDHVGLVDKFPGVPIYGHINNKPWIEKDDSFFTYYQQYFNKLYQLAGVPEEYNELRSTLKSTFKLTGTATLSDSLQEGQLLPGHPDFKVIETPGHAQSHLSFYRAIDGSLIGGDLILSNSSSNPLLEPPKHSNDPRPRPLLQYLESLDKISNYEISTVYPGHGPTFTNVKELILLKLAKHQQRSNKVIDIFGKESLTIFQLCQQLFPKQYRKQLGLTMSETVGQLDYLEYKSMVTCKEEHGIYYYTKKKMIGD